jgi:hypothetical protein
MSQTPKIIAFGSGFVGKRHGAAGAEYFDRSGSWKSLYGGPAETMGLKPFATTGEVQSAMAAHASCNSTVLPGVTLSDYVGGSLAQPGDTFPISAADWEGNGSPHLKHSIRNALAHQFEKYGVSNMADLEAAQKREALEKNAVTRDGQEELIKRIVDRIYPDVPPAKSTKGPPADKMIRSGETRTK